MTTVENGFHKTQRFHDVQKLEVGTTCALLCVAPETKDRLNAIASYWFGMTLDFRLWVADD